MTRTHRSHAQLCRHISAIGVDALYPHPFPPQCCHPWVPTSISPVRKKLVEQACGQVVHSPGSSSAFHVCTYVHALELDHAFADHPEVAVWYILHSHIVQRLPKRHVVHEPVHDACTMRRLLNVVSATRGSRRYDVAPCRHITYCMNKISNLHEPASAAPTLTIGCLQVLVGI